MNTHLTITFSYQINSLVLNPFPFLSSNNSSFTSISLIPPLPVRPTNNSISRVQKRIQNYRLQTINRKDILSPLHKCHDVGSTLNVEQHYKSPLLYDLTHKYNTSDFPDMLAGARHDALEKNVKSYHARHK